MSIPYTMASAAVSKKDLFIDDFTEESIRHSEVLEFAQKVRVQVDPDIDRIVDNVVANRVEFETRECEHCSEYVEFLKGHPKNPMTMCECIEKFQKCFYYSAKPLKQGRMGEVVQLVSQFQELDDVKKLVQLLVG